MGLARILGKSQQVDLPNVDMTVQLCNRNFLWAGDNYGSLLIATSSPGDQARRNW